MNGIALRYLELHERTKRSIIRLREPKVTTTSIQTGGWQVTSNEHRCNISSPCAIQLFTTNQWLACSANWIWTCIRVSSSLDEADEPTFNERHCRTGLLATADESQLGGCVKWIIINRRKNIDKIKHGWWRWLWMDIDQPKSQVVSAGWSENWEQVQQMAVFVARTHISTSATGPGRRDNPVS